MSGADTIEKAKELQNELTMVLKRGGFNLRKWKANSKEIMDMLPDNLKDLTNVEINKGETVKTLGIHWSPATDKFQFKVNLDRLEKPPTKRTILSDIAKVYDPLGWLAPVIIKAKILLQELWIKKYTWDQSLHQDIADKWIKFRKELQSIEKIEVPRWIHYAGKNCSLEIHGFADASEKAYGAVVYSKIIKDNKTYITLLASKTRVAPLKKLTIPRLELCGALLLARLIKQVQDSLELKNIKLYLWTDSMITLAWINGDASKWKSFVSNRTAEIQILTKVENWKHVKSEDNPADLASRGIDPQSLKEKTLWWCGPSWLTKPENEWPTSKIKTETDQELKKAEIVATTATTFDSILSRYSTLKKLIHVIAYCYRFIENCKRCKKHSNIALTVEEIKKAKQQIIRITQGEEFTAELQQLKSCKPVENKSKIKQLNPFLDEQGILRVNGRLKNANISYDEKYPIILPHKHIVTELVIKDAHDNTMHGGNETTLAYIRRQFWIIGSRNKTRQVLKKCVICQRYRGASITQMMGQLPACRITPSKPFTNTGIDYAGPIQVRMTKGRGSKSYKGYIAIFICMSTKAIHIEIVSDMTTEAFMAAFRRFTARRGLPSNIYSDNGTTFVGAKKVIENDFRKALKDIQSEVISLTSEKLTWNFIPPAAPHFGGIWEAGVKSTKYHLRRVIGDSTLTFEELSTLVYQIEACLNSRPLCPVSSDPETTLALTPAHFLIGQSLVTPVEPSKLHENIPRSLRWKLIQKMTQDFWKKWQSEYLSRLQQRPKWKKGNYKIEVGAIVLVKDENCPPTKWPLARIIDTHPGDDGIVRVVTLRCKENTILKRPVTKICFLPIDTEDITPVDNHKASTSTTLLARKVLTDQTIQRETKQKINRKTYFNKLYFIQFLLTTMIILGNVLPIRSHYTIHHPQPGFYVEHAGEVRIKRGTLRIDIDTNLNITEEIIKINNIVNHMETACRQSKRFEKETHCDTLLEHLKDKKVTLENELEIIDTLKVKRVKRGLVGKLLQSIFGVNDEIYTDIDHLNQNQELLKQSLHHQSSILVSTTAKINELGSRTEEKIKLIKEKLNQVIVEVNKQEGWYTTIDGNKVGIQILAAYQISYDLFNNMEEKYSKIITMKSNKGTILDFITPSELKKVISNATAKLPDHLMIVDEPETRTETKMSDVNITISGFLHITEKSTYELSKITPIPQKVAMSTYIVPDVTTGFMAIDYNSQNYFERTEDELKNCINLKKHSLLCAPNIVSNIETNPTCIIDHLYHRQKKSECIMKNITITNIAWKHLYTPNTWLFVANTPTEVAITCNGEREDILLEDTGIIRTNQECVIKTNLNTLLSEIRNKVNIKSTFIKPLKYNFSATEPFLQTQSSRRISLEPILSITDSWTKLSEVPEEKYTILKWKYIGHHAATASISITTTIILVLMGKWAYDYKRSRPYNSKDHTTPDFNLHHIEIRDTP